MDNPSLENPEPQRAQTLSPSSSGRRSNCGSSTEFEFWMVRNPSFPQPNLLSADQLFSDGVLLPLHLLPLSHDPHPEPPNSEPPPNQQPEAEPSSGPELLQPDSLTTTLTTSKRWKDIFKKSDRKYTHEDKDKDRKKERKAGVGSGGGNGVSSAELNINIWPFSRSRSAGNGGTRPRMVAGSAAATRKVSSAPCSRSNSAGESRKWPSSPSRGGVHLARSSPVWQVRRGGSGGRSSEPLSRNAEKGVKKERGEIRRIKTTATAACGGVAGGGAAKAKVLNLNVPMCIGYRHHLSCGSDENSAVVVAVTAARESSTNIATPDGGVGSSSGGRGSRNMFNLRSLFTKKVY